MTHQSIFESDYPYMAVNNQVILAKECAFPIADYGFFYGYGVFETLLIQDKKSFFLAEHINRLKKAAAELYLPFRFSFEEIQALIFELIEKNNINTAILNIYLTAGEKSKDKSSQFSNSQLWSICRSFDKSPKPVVLGVTQDLSDRSHLDAHKQMSCLKNIWLKRDLKEKGCEDFILYNRFHEILETTIANIFFVSNKTLIIPNNPYILPGIMREKIIELATHHQINYEIRPVYLTELSQFDEIFLTNSLRGVIAVDSTQGYPNLISKEMAAKFSSARMLK